MHSNYIAGRPVSQGDLWLTRPRNCWLGIMATDSSTVKSLQTISKDTINQGDEHRAQGTGKKWWFGRGRRCPTCGGTGTIPKGSLLSVWLHCFGSALASNPGPWNLVSLPPLPLLPSLISSLLAPLPPSSPCLLCHINMLSSVQEYNHNLSSFWIHRTGRWAGCSHPI